MRATAACVLFALLGLAEASVFSTAAGYRAVYSHQQPTNAMPNATRVLCIALCSVDTLCSIANYHPSSQTCETLQGGEKLLQQNASWQLLFRADFDDGLEELLALYQIVPGVKIVGAQKERSSQNYAIAGFNSGWHCLRLCEIVAGDNCSVVTYKALTRECVISAEDFYSEWTIADATDASWVGYYKRKPGSWKLLLKASRGSGVDVDESFFNIATFNDSASEADLAGDDTCGCYIKNQIVNNWSFFPIQKLKMAYFSKGQLLKFIDFRAAADTKTSFFKTINIDNSSWSDLNFTTVMCCAGTGQWMNRDFYTAYANDIGWMATGATPGSVATSNTNTAPQFGYSNLTTRDNFNNARFAEAMLIFAQL